MRCLKGRQLRSAVPLEVPGRGAHYRFWCSAAFLTAVAVGPSGEFVAVALVAHVQHGVRASSLLFGPRRAVQRQECAAGAGDL